MDLNKSGVAKAVKMLGMRHARLLVRMAEKQQVIENEWISELEHVHSDIVEEILDRVRQGKKPKVSDDLIVKYLIAHYFKVLGVAMEDAERELDLILPGARLAKSPKIPSSFRDLRKIYDTWRRSGRLPEGLKGMGERIKENYLKKTQSVWKKYSEDFRNGDEFTQENVLRKIKKAAQVGGSRAKTIVRTETTNFYNKARTEIYDQSDAVTHYLFLAIRDQATTSWCTDKVIEGKRGRHGLVYKKGDELTERETPACHWNCRSEMVPLTPYNARHRKLISDESLQRRNHKCTPLPEGWR